MFQQLAVTWISNHFPLYLWVVFTSSFSESRAHFNIKMQSYQCRIPIISVLSSAPERQSLYWNGTLLLAYNFLYHHYSDITWASHGQLGYLYNNLFRLTTAKSQSSTLLILCEGNPPLTHWSVEDSPHKGPVMWNTFPCHDVMVFFVAVSKSNCVVSHLYEFVSTEETLYNTVNFWWSTHKRHSIARPKGRGMGCLLWVQRTTYCVDLSKLSSIKYLL